MNSEISKAVECLENGGIIIYPSDTIWALGCDATNSRAIKRIFKIKKRKSTLPLICLMNDYQMLNKYVNVTEEIKAFLHIQKKPTTIIYKMVKKFSFYNESVAIRIPKDKFCQNLLSEFNKPITSTSVNISGDKFPECFNEIKDEILNQIDYSVNLKRNLKLKKPSQIIKIEGDSFITLRS